VLVLFQSGEDLVPVMQELGVAIGGQLGGVAGAWWWAVFGGAGPDGGPGPAGEGFVESADHDRSPPVVVVVVWCRVQVA
jgi:hypothetical protein